MALAAHEHATARGAAVSTQGHWLGDPARPLFGWLTTPAGSVTASAALVLPDVAAQYWSAHHTLRALAERLGQAGHTVLRLDYDGTGDSAGDQWDAGRVAAWRASAAAGARELHELGCRHLTVIGVRFGAAVALLDGAALGADEVVAWAPPASGKRFGRSLRLIGEPIPGSDGLVSAGVVFTPETVSDLAGLDITRVPTAPAPRTLVLGAAGAAALDHLRALAGEVDHDDPADAEVALERSTEEADVSDGVVEAICDWVTPAAGEAVAPAPAPSPMRLTWDGAALTERVVAPAGLVGVLTEPVAPRERPATVVFLNAGSESHVGPGRAWVEYARSLAAAGHRALRVDWRGWGESADDGLVPGRPYDDHVRTETVALVEALRADGHERIVLVGLCASAWIALRVVREAPLAGVVAINPQMYWQPGDPVLSQVDTGIERTDKRLREERGCRWGLWTALDVAGHRPPAGRWLDELASTRVPVLALFSERDDGLHFLRTRLGRRTRRAVAGGTVHVEEVEGIDHGMHRAWLRPRMVRTMLDHLDRLA